MKTFITRRKALFSAAIAVPVVLQSGSAAEAAQPKPKGKEGPLHRAIHELHGAKVHLERAGHDFGGHKGHALKEIEAALKALLAALEYEEKKGA